MFQHPHHTAQFAADLRLARRRDAGRRRARRLSVTDQGEAGSADPAGFVEAGVDVAAVVRTARRRGLGTTLAAIVADPTQPGVARERALGRLLAVLAAPDQGGRSRAAPPAA